MNYVLQVEKKELSTIKAHYLDRLVENKNQYVAWQAKDKAITVTAYLSGKVMFQGILAEQEYQDWYDHFNKAISTIGSDEVGTGDFFGPIVVVAAFVPVHHIKPVQNLGVKDSKSLNDDQIIEIAKELKQFVIHKPVILNNHYYNKLYDQVQNLNKIKAIMHNRALTELTTQRTADLVVVDQFCEPNLYYKYLTDEKNVYNSIHFETKAESKYLSVAVASILARYYFLMEWIKMENTFGMLLPKGASNKVDQVCADILKNKGMSSLREIAKLNFKTIEKAEALNKPQLF